jgi:hypothetical protein
MIYSNAIFKNAKTIMGLMLQVILNNYLTISKEMVKKT